MTSPATAAEPANGFSKRELICGKKDIDTLVSTGHWGSMGHIKYCWHSNGVGVNRILVSVPKKFFKRAVKRNLLKRRIREAYRTQKFLLPPATSLGGTDVLLQYNSNELFPYAVIRAEVAAVLAAVAAKTFDGGR